MRVKNSLTDCSIYIKTHDCVDRFLRLGIRIFGNLSGFFNSIKYHKLLVIKMNKSLIIISVLVFASCSNEEWLCKIDGGNTM